ncbi:STAS domain-containing protein [Gammaproteobacteria bacterium AB-CW1]|uniref:STAS domain-containing protein n=1 Tax=Natronospira elongata TaxID=3110268 RepID=A0AAP6MLB5_9GAMM|nr:STAS domain-containing protein [Gammaproteobacteria bacterium AB-CW1]
MADQSPSSLDLEKAGRGRYRLSGELVFGTAEQALTLSQSLDFATTVELDLSGVKRVDSAGLAVMVEWWRRCQAAGGQLKLGEIPEQLKALIRISQLDSVFGDLGG